MAFFQTSDSSSSESSDLQIPTTISEPMQITVTTCYGCSIIAKTLNVTTATLVGAVKNLIEPSIDQSRKSLAYTGMVLENDQSLSFYRIKSNSDVLMVITPTASEEAELPKIVVKKFHPSPSHGTMAPSSIELSSAFESALTEMLEQANWKSVDVPLPVLIFLASLRRVPFARCVEFHVEQPLRYKQIIKQRCEKKCS